MILFKYQIIIFWSEEDNCFIAEVPELSGCAADGKSHKEVLENVQEVIEEWVETAKLAGREIPQPMGKRIYV